MRRLLLFICMALAAVLPVRAQTTQQPTDYRIYPISQSLSEDREQFIVTFGVYNTGGDAAVESTVILVVAATGEQLGTERMRPLRTNEAEEVEFTFPVRTFPPGTAQSLQATVGIGEVEEQNAGTIGNNQTRVGIVVPDYEPTNAPTTQPATGSSTPIPQGTQTAGRPVFTIPGVNFQVDLTNPIHAAVLIGVCGIGLVLLWVLTVILRLLFAKPPTMLTWQPPYASSTMLDPNSAAGRRQLWQPHAQNDALLMPCAEGTYHIRKLLLGTDNMRLSGWKVIGIRLSQYDMYGRVARSNTIATSGPVNRLNKLAHKKNQNDIDKAMRQVRPIANALLGQFEKKLSKRNAMLPVAFDVRFRGEHGDVKILFELFGCRGANWQLIDQWEPEMTVLRGSIQENFTYTLFGMHPGEDYKSFKKRLREEVTRALAEMVTRERAVRPSASATAETPSVTNYVPQDTSPNPPVEA